MLNIEQKLIGIKKLIAHYEELYGRKPGSVGLLAASKGQSIEKIIAAYHAGQRAFGENYLQDALTKMETLSEFAIEWHFIGKLQSNKIKKIAEHFDWVHSIDNEKDAERLNEHRPSHLKPLNVCIEVNVSHEPSKSGVRFEGVLPLAIYCRQLPHLNLRGIMSIPAPQPDIFEQRRTFHKLFLLWQLMQEEGMPLDTLSMGMSDDFEAAIAEGATLVRIGRGIFGARKT